MALQKISEYGVGDVNFDSMMLTLDATRRNSLSLSEMDTETIPVIEAGSIVDIGGALFVANSDESISTIDPYTSAEVADGMVYVVLIASGGTAAAAFTATAPVWRGDYQGYYKSSTVDKMIGKMYKQGTIYKRKTVFFGKFEYTKLKVVINAINNVTETFQVPDNNWRFITFDTEEIDQTNSFEFQFQ